MSYNFDDKEKSIVNHLEIKKQFDEFGNEYWNAQDFVTIFTLKNYFKVVKCLTRSIISCNQSGITASFLSPHFTYAPDAPESNQKAVVFGNFRLSSFACYLLAKEVSSFHPHATNVDQVCSYFYKKVENVNPNLLSLDKRQDFDPNSPTVRSLPQSISVDADDLDSIFGDFQNQIKDRVRQLIAQEFYRQLNKEISRLFDRNESTTKL